MSYTYEPPMHDPRHDQEFGLMKYTLYSKTRIGKLTKQAEFIEGQPFRNGTVVNDESMKKEALDYQKTWIKEDRRVLVVRSDGELIANHL